MAAIARPSTAHFSRAALILGLTGCKRKEIAVRRCTRRRGFACLFPLRGILVEVFSFRTLLLLHGYAFLFFYVLAVQTGVPVPADPLLLIMGALAADRIYSIWLAMGAALAAALLGDLFWYELGRIRGRPILNLLCKLSLEPDSCIRKTEADFSKRGAWTLLIAKFVPGMSLISMPLAGAIRMPRVQFLMADAAGCLLWVSAYILAGYVFHHQVNTLIDWLGLFGRRAGVIAVVLLALYIVFKLVQRWRFRRELRINRITPEEALALIEGGAPVSVVDLRNRLEVEADGRKIVGALVLTPEDLRSRSHEIPEQHEVILYCS